LVVYCACFVLCLKAVFHPFFGLYKSIWTRLFGTLSCEHLRRLHAMIFEFATAQRIVFGTGRIAELPEMAKPLGRKPALVTGGNAERIMPVFDALKFAGFEPAAFSITGEPDIPRIESHVQKAREVGCDFVIAFGGGSVIDAGKAIAALLTNPGAPLDYLEVIGAGQPLTEEPAPCIAIPTTAGTGAEVTRNSVLASPEHKVKVSMRHPKMLPTIALVDPKLTLSMPQEVTASTGLDAFTQLLESFVSIKSNPMTDSFCREGLKRAARSLHRAYINGENLETRTDMALASLFGGLALANAGLGAVHGFAGPIGGMFDAPHGTVCATLLPGVCTANLQALQERDAGNPAMTKYVECAAIVTGNPNASTDDLLNWIKDLCIQMFVPGLEDSGIRQEDIPSITKKAMKASSMKDNPIELTTDELHEILFDALHPPMHGEATLYL
jgi:alcohol dehydrogenase class IV